MVWITNKAWRKSLKANWKWKRQFANFFQRQDSWSRPCWRNKERASRKTANLFPMVFYDLPFGFSAGSFFIWPSYDTRKIKSASSRLKIAFGQPWRWLYLRVVRGPVLKPRHYTLINSRESLPFLSIRLRLLINERIMPWFYYFILAPPLCFE